MITVNEMIGKLQLLSPEDRERPLIVEMEANEMYVGISSKQLVQLDTDIGIVFALVTEEITDG